MEEVTAVRSLQQTEIASDSWREADGFKEDVGQEADDINGITAPYFKHSIIMLLGTILFITPAFDFRGSISLCHPGMS